MAGESDLEAEIRKAAIRLGWLFWKFVSPGLRGVPDRLLIRDGRVIFMEIKAPGEEPSRQQLKRRDDLVAAGVEWCWVDSLEDALVILA